MQKRTLRAILCLLSVLYSSLVTPVSAAAPADAKIKAALYDIDRYEKQFAGKTSERAPTVKRALKLLTISREKLDASPNKSHPSWQEANARHTTLVAHLQSLLNPNSGSTGTATPTATQPAIRPQASPTPTSSQPPQMISQQRARIKKLNRDINSAIQTLDQGGVKPFQDQNYVSKFTAAADRFTQSLNKYANFATDPDVQTTTTTLQKMRNMLRFGNDQAAKTRAKLGDIQGQLRTVYNRLQSSQPPPLPQAPYANNALPKWIDAAAALRQASLQDLPKIQLLKQEAYLPLTRGTVEQGAAFDMQNVDSILSGLQGDISQIDSTLKQLSDNLDLQVKDVSESLVGYANLDPTQAKDRTNSFLREGAEAETHTSLAEKQQLIKAAIAFDQRLKRKTLADRQALYTRIEKTRSDFDAKRIQALQLMRMPKTESTDKTLLNTAKETLAKPTYEVGKIVRLVINAKLVHREKESSEVDFDKVDVSISGKVKLSGTQTTTRYVWDQYQVATAEPVGDKYYIFYNTLKYFTAGATTTPLNRWLLSGRFQGAEIPLDNINKN